jgi:integrase
VGNLNLVQPIRDSKKVQAMKEYLKNENKRDYILFLLGVGTGLRISDILKLRKRDLLDTHIITREKKTGKPKRLRITPSIRKELNDYLKELEDDDYVIKSRQGFNRPIDRSRAYTILKSAAANCNIKEIGTHTLRKTFGYHFYKQTGDIAMLMQLFNHSDEKITLRYIGITQDSMDEAMIKYKI